MSFISDTFNIGKKNMVVGNGIDDFDISSINGKQVKINGTVPSSGGGGVPAVGDIDFIGNLNCNDVAGGGTKGVITAEKKINSGSGGIESTGLIKTTAAADINSGKDIIFDGQDIYKAYPGIVPPEPNKTYKDYKGLVAVGDNSVFTGDNVFRETIKVQLTNGAVPPVLDDKIILNKDGTINADSQITASGLICENGADDTNFVKARIFDFRPKGANAAPDNELTGWNLSQKAPQDPPIAADNYLMLQNTQPTGSFNLVKSTFDPNNPVPFDIILDPQNGQVKTITSFDAPKVNFRKNATNCWSISQPAANDPAEGTLIIRSPNTLGSVNIFDSASTPWAQFSSVGTTLPKPTTINNTLNVNGNTTLGSTNSLLFGGYVFRPIQYTLNIANFPIKATEDAFTKIFTSVSNFTNINTGATAQQLVKGFYKLSVSQTSLSTPSGSYDDLGILCDFVYRVPTDALPDNQLPNPLSFSYGKYLTTGAPEIEIRRNATGGQDVHLTFPTSGTGGESMAINVKLTKMDF